jgi:signal transduction histidine kinase
MGRQQAAPSARGLVAAFAAVAVSFVLATLVSEHSDVKIRRDAELITGNAAPSIVHVEAFRSEARHLVVIADDQIDRALENQRSREQTKKRRRPSAAPVASVATPPAAVDTTLLTSSLTRLETEWELYRALPTFPGERALAGVVGHARDAFVGDLQRALSATNAGDAAGALAILEQQVKPAADALDDAAVKLVERNAEEADRLGARIDWLGRRSILRAAALDGLSVLLTVLAAFLVVRFMRRYTRLVELRAEELELFAGRVAHDVLSPLGAASLALSYLDEKAGIEDPRARRMLKLGQRGIERTRLIADDLLEFASSGARPDPTARADVRLVVGAVVEEARALADERKVALSIDGVDPGSVRCSLGILSSLVSNLVRNGVKYVGAGPGKIVCVRARRQGAFMRIEVEDNGPGLPPAMEAAVFEPYVRGPNNHQPGVGLGLATVKRIVEAHGGRVHVRSTTRSVARSGCLFALELPYAGGVGSGSGEVMRVGTQTGSEKALPPPEKPPTVGPEPEDERRRDISPEDTNPSSHPG